MLRNILKYTLKLLSMAVLAKYHPIVIAITGSVGKSSAKEAIRTVLENSLLKRLEPKKKI